MFLFLGTRPGKEKIRRLQGLRCALCNQKDTLTGFMRSNYFHLFWIKLFKIARHEMIECSHCKRVYYKEGFNREMEAALKK